MTLVPDWKNAWKWFSVQALAVIAVIPFVWDQLPQDVKNLLPDEYQPYVFAVIAIAGILGRIKDQK